MVRGNGKTAYYPGCSLNSSAREMGESFLELVQGFGLEMSPLQDWSCCGSSPAHSTHHGRALNLAARNLLLAEAQGIEELMVMCPSCFVRLKEAERQICSDPAKASQVKRCLGKSYRGSVRLRFFLEVMDCWGLEALRDKVRIPLNGLRGALYYGCLLSRPEWITGFDVGPYEEFLEGLFRALGGEPVRWGLGKQCCGAHLAVSKPGLADHLVDRIRDQARRAGAHCLVVFCPLCQVNLELRGRHSGKLPVLYITEVLGIATQSPNVRSWMGRHLVDPRSLLASIAGT